MEKKEKKLNFSLTICIRGPKTLFQTAMLWK